jgi:signal transduction histidine kinase
LSATSKSTVWIADDSRLEREVVAAALADVYAVEAFADGADLLERLGNSVAPDAIVTDLFMADVGGVEVVQFVRAQPGISDLGIIVLTGNQAEGDVSNALLAGADDFARKPVEASELRARLARLIAKRDARVRLERELSMRWLDERRRVTDVKEELAVERRMREDVAEQAHLRELFMGILGHDLRTPLSAIVLSLAALERPDVSAERNAAMAARIRASVARMTELVSRVLDVTRARFGGGIPVEPRRVDCRVVCQQIVDELRDANPEREIRFEVAGDTILDVDAPRLAQVVSNLAGNALQHGARDSAVTVRVVGTSDAVAIEVHNLGAAISGARLATLFEPFRRGGGAGPATGLGLGLFISRQLVEAHHGTLAVQSDAGGTTFTATLPRAR